MGPFRSELEAWAFAILLLLIALAWLLLLTGCQMPLR